MLSQALFASRAMAVAALPILILSSVSRDTADGGAKVGEILHYLQGVVADSNCRSGVDILNQYVGFLEADGKAKLCACICKASDKSLEGTLSVCSKSSVICKQHLPYEYPADLSLCSEAGEVEEVPITPSMEEDPVFGVAEGIAQEQGEEHAKECWRQDTPLLHTTPDWEGV